MPQELACAQLQPYSGPGGSCSSEIAWFTKTPILKCLQLASCHSKGACCSTVTYDSEKDCECRALQMLPAEMLLVSCVIPMYEPQHPQAA